MALQKKSQESRTRSSTASKPNLKNPRYALLSVSDKTGIVEFARGLVHLGYQIIATGGTAKALSDAGIMVVPIQDVTGNPESFDGRMKTISFQIESAILYDRQNPKHRKEAETLGIKQIDIVVCNLYPFEQTVASKSVRIADAVEKIDVGGPTMVRSAAKNFKNVVVLVDPKDYDATLSALKTRKVSDVSRQELAAKAFAHVSFYDSQIARFLRVEEFPEEITLAGRKTFALRYGENMHQRGFVYFEPNTISPLRHLTHLSGRTLSYMNFTDMVAGLEVVRQFSEPASVVIKHNTPSGIAVGKRLDEALARSVVADAESAFGGAIVLNKPLDLKTAKTFAAFKEEEGVLIDIVAAPSMTDDAKEFIHTIRKSTGIYSFGTIAKNRSTETHIRAFDGGFLMQDWDDTVPDFKKWQVVTKRKPTEKERAQMELAWKFVSRVRSNTIVIVDPTIPMTRGIGSGQTSRVRAVRIALEQAKKYTPGAILASDSFFPFDDSVKLAAKYGIGAIIQQGGSVRDEDSIKAADEAGMTMVFTGERKFWH